MIEAGAHQPGVVADMADKPTIVYYYRGILELRRPGGRIYRTAGYSPNGPNGGEIQPWLTIAGCLTEAASQGAAAKFVYEEGEEVG
jgi:hypothetical protein